MDDDKELEVGEWLIDRLLARSDVASITYRVKMNCSPIGKKRKIIGEKPRSRWSSND